MKKRQARLTRAFVYLCALAVLWWCGPVPELLAQDSVSKNTLRLAVNVLPPGFGSPYRTTATPSITTTSALFDGLTRLDHLGNVSPWLAERWEPISETRWRFYLRKDVVFSNGVPFESSAVAHVVTYLSEPGAPLESVRRDMPWLAGAKIIDDHTVDILTKVPVPTFDRYAATLLMTEPGAFNGMGPEAYALNPVVTGPFLITAWQPNNVRMKANPTTWRPPKLDGLEIIALPDSTTRVQAVLSERVDVAVALGPDEAQMIADAGGSFMTFSAGQIANVTFNTLGDTPFKDVRVRRALNMAVNRDLIIEVLVAGSTEPANQPATKTSFGYNPDLPLFPYDPERARALLAEAGYPNGFSFKLRTSLAGPGQASVYQQVASDLRSIGVEMVFDVVPSTLYLSELIRLGEIAEAFTLPIALFPTVDSMRAMSFHSCLWPSPGYCNETIQPVIEQALIEWDQDKAIELRRQVMAHYHDQAAVLYLHESPSFVGLSARVRNYGDVFGFVGYDVIELVN
jgi:peptide/nickel transport system substrate-binding protein